MCHIYMLRELLFVGHINISVGDYMLYIFYYDLFYH
jgi:hypothetical protein